jgi:hypothetical protein
MRRKLIIGLVAMGLTATAVHAPAYNRICSSRVLQAARQASRSEPACGPARQSAQSFRQYFHDLKSAGSSLSPIERLVFSLVLANAKTTSECPVEAAPPPART